MIIHRQRSAMPQAEHGPSREVRIRNIFRITIHEGHVHRVFAQIGTRAVELFEQTTLKANTNRFADSLHTDR